MATLRRAVPADAAELVRLRALMHEAMGTPADDPEWWRVCREAFERRLGGDLLFVAFVVEEDAGQVVSCGAGFIEEHLPSPVQHDGRRGHIASMSTDPEHRRRGHGQAVFEALMGWMTEQGLVRVDLRATDDGRRLYERFGFRVLGGTSMAWTAPGVRPGMPGA
ncbi:MAG: GNAT family N-acetyltransferase [Actinomycetota bacterium]|nr:GNAT family N-acetyltransferase [Actinomycetota bacterium]